VYTHLPGGVPVPDDPAARIANNDFGDAETVTTRELRDRLSELVGRCA